MSTIYLIRHCETTGQAPEAPLTPRGEEDDLKERRLSAVPLDDWQDHLRRTFIDPDYTCPGGESSRIATKRITRVVEKAL